MNIESSKSSKSNWIRNLTNITIAQYYQKIVKIMKELRKFVSIFIKKLTKIPNKNSHMKEIILLLMILFKEMLCFLSSKTK